MTGCFPHDDQRLDCVAVYLAKITSNNTESFLGEGKCAVAATVLSSISLLSMGDVVSLFFMSIDDYSIEYVTPATVILLSSQLCPSLENRDTTHTHLYTYTHTHTVQYTNMHTLTDIHTMSYTQLTFTWIIMRITVQEFLFIYLYLINFHKVVIRRLTVMSSDRDSS